MKEILYKMPERSTDLAKVIRALPDSWSGIAFYLTPAKRTYSDINITPRVLIEITKRLYSAPSLAVSKYTSREPETESIGWVKDLILDGALPEAVHAKLHACNFETHGSPALFKEAKEIAASFVFRGYEGELDAYNAVADGVYYTTEDFEYKPEIFKIRSRSRYISLLWHDDLGGRRKSFESVLNVCKKLGLEELNEDCVKSL